MSADRDLRTDLEAIDRAAGAWTGREEDGAAYIEHLRPGRRLKAAASREGRDASRRWTNTVWGVVTTVALSLLSFPLAGFALMFFAMGMTNSDTSGQGAPFRSCTEESIQCDGGNPLFVIGSVLALAALVAAIAFIGHRVGRFRLLRVGWPAMAAVAIAVLAGTAVITYSVLTVPW